MVERRRKFDISVLGREQFRPSVRRRAEADDASPPPAKSGATAGATAGARSGATASELLTIFKELPRKPLLVSEIASAVDRPADTCVDLVIALVRAGSLDLLQWADGGDHLVALSPAGRAQLATI